MVVISFIYIYYNIILITMIVASIVAIEIKATHVDHNGRKIQDVFSSETAQDRGRTSVMMSLQNWAFGSHEELPQSHVHLTTGQCIIEVNGIYIYIMNSIIHMSPCL